MTEAAQVSPQAVGYPTTLALSDAPWIHLCSRLLIEIGEALIGIGDLNEWTSGYLRSIRFNDIADSRPSDQLDGLRLASLDVVEDGASLDARQFRQSWNQARRENEDRLHQVI
jgi:hypothetical protein